MDRYSRQIFFEGIKLSGQKKLSRSHVCIVGCGALGSRCGELLARAGIGWLTLIDRDFVELNNLQRQTLYLESDVNKAKAAQLGKHLKKINSETKIDFKVADLDHKNIDMLRSDIILGCTDNLESRFLINDYSLNNNIPWNYGGAIESHGMVFNIIPGKPCFRCIFQEASNLATCDTVGIINTIASVIASIQANECIKILLGKEYEQNLLYIDLWTNEFSKIKVNKNPDCPACNANYEFLTRKKAKEIIKFCGTGNYQIKGKKVKLSELKNKLKRSGKVTDMKYCLHFKNMTVFEDGRTLIKAKNKTEAKSVYSRYIGD